MLHMLYILNIKREAFSSGFVPEYNEWHPSDITFIPH
jgi:hypothetical protein